MYKSIGRVIVITYKKTEMGKGGGGGEMGGD